jgi:hypothetical protein
MPMGAKQEVQMKKIADEEDEESKKEEDKVKE